MRHEAAQGNEVKEEDGRDTPVREGGERGGEKLYVKQREKSAKEGGAGSWRRRTRRTRRTRRMEETDAITCRLWKRRRRRR